MSHNYNDIISEYFNPIYENIYQDMINISKYYDKILEEIKIKNESKDDYLCNQKSTLEELIMYHSFKRLPDSKIIERVKNHKWISYRDIERVNSRNLLNGMCLYIY